MIKRLGVFLLIAVLFLAGCSPAATVEAPREAGGRGAEAPAVAMPPGDVDNSAGESQGQPSTDRIVIRNAELTILVENPTQVMGTVGTMAEGMGGFIVSSNLYKTYAEGGQEVPEGTITVRVPAARFNEALRKIKGQVKDPDNDVRNEIVSGQDVTKEYTDLNSRLKNLQEAERQMREIMASATKTEDVLSVHAQLTQIREQIEVIQGQIQYYEEAAALSSISVRILALATAKPLEVGGWQPVGVARNAVQALIDTMQVLGSMVIWVVIYILPVGVVIFLPIWFVVKLLSRGAKGRKIQAAAPPANPQ